MISQPLRRAADHTGVLEDTGAYTDQELAESEFADQFVTHLNPVRRGPFDPDPGAMPESAQQFSAPPSRAQGRPGLPRCSSSILPAARAGLRPVEMVFIRDGAGGAGSNWRYPCTEHPFPLLIGDRLTVAPQSKVDAVVNLINAGPVVPTCGEITAGYALPGTTARWGGGENIKRQWWWPMVTGPRGRRRPGFTGDPAAPGGWPLGHVAVFNDPLVECLSCRQAAPADHLQEAYAEKRASMIRSRCRCRRSCVPTAATGAWTEPRLQHDAQDLPRPDRDRRGSALPAARKRPRRASSSISERMTPPPGKEASVRNRPDRQEFPQRDHPGEFIFRARSSSR